MLSRSAPSDPSTRTKVALAVSHAHGGIREIWSDLAEGLTDAGFDASLIGLYPYANTIEPADAMAWQYLHKGQLKGLVALVRLAISMTTWLRRERPDFIISAMPAANVLLPVFARIFSPGTKVILSHHSMATVYRSALNWLDRGAGQLSNVTAIVAVSDAVLRSLDDKPRPYREKCVVIHNSVSPRIETLLAQLAGRRSQRPGGCTIVACGRIEAVKNHEMVIRALVDCPGVEFNIVGDGSLEPDLHTLASKLGVAGRVHFLGSQLREDALALVADADAFVQMSLNEGHSLALIEAAKLGLPLILSNVPSQVEGAIADDGSQCAKLIDLGDVDGLAEALRTTLHDPGTRAQMQAQSRKLAAKSSFAAMLGAYVDLIADCDGRPTVAYSPELKKAV